MKMVNPGMYESLFHPNLDSNGLVIPYYPTSLGKHTAKLKNDVIKNMETNGFNKNTLNGKKIIIVSGDGHSYSLLLIDEVLSGLGAKTVNGGVDINPINALDLADEEGSSYIFISTHCGQSLDYARQISELAKGRTRKYHIFMGGKLNANLPGDLKPSDVTGLINKTGVYAIDDLVEAVRKINEL